MDAFGSLVYVPRFQSKNVPWSKPSNASDDRKMEIESEGDEVANELSDSNTEEGPLVGRLQKQPFDMYEYFHPRRMDDGFNGNDEDIVTGLWWRQRIFHR